MQRGHDRLDEERGGGAGEDDGAREGGDEGGEGAGRGEEERVGEVLERLREAKARVRVREREKEGACAEIAMAICSPGR